MDSHYLYMELASLHIPHFTISIILDLFTTQKLIPFSYYYFYTSNHLKILDKTCILNLSYSPDLTIILTKFEINSHNNYNDQSIKSLESRNYAEKKNQTRIKRIFLKTIIVVIPLIFNPSFIV